MQPIDAPRVRRPNARAQEKRAYAAEKAMAEATVATGRERPAWMRDKTLLPRKPPTKTGRP